MSCSVIQSGAPIFPVGIGMRSYDQSRRNSGRWATTCSSFPATDRLPPSGGSERPIPGSATGNSPTPPIRINVHFRDGGNPSSSDEEWLAKREQREREPRIPSPSGESEARGAKPARGEGDRCHLESQFSLSPPPPPPPPPGRRVLVSVS